MCGCMLMHAGMDHSGRQPADQPMTTPHAKVMPAFGPDQCFHCRFPVQQGFAFCPNCGTSLNTSECPACGRKVDRAWSACAYCGSPLGDVKERLGHH